MTKKEKIVQKVKVVGELVSSCGASSLACGICAAVLPPGLGAVVKGGVLLGGLLLGGFVGEKLNDYVDRQIDLTADTIEEHVIEIKHNIDILKDMDKETEE